MDYFDCIIVGAGPAGLLLAKELSRKHKILVLEKNKIGETNKNWITLEDRWEKEKFPASFIENRFNRWHVNYKYKGKKTSIIIKDKVICFNEHKFLKFLAKITLENKGNILEETPLKNIRRENNQLVINNEFSTKLLIDCSGVDSTILKKYNLVEFPVYINCCAYIAKFKELDNHNYYELFKRKEFKKPFFFGITKIAPKLAQLQFYKYSFKREYPIKYLKKMKSILIEKGLTNHKLVEWKTTSYPTGVLKKSTLNNIFLFGDAGFYSPPLNGMGFNEILRQYKKVSKHLDNCLNNKKFKENDLRIPKDIAVDLNNSFFRLFALIINFMPSKLVYDFMTMLSGMSNINKKRIMRNNITDKEALDILKKFIKITDLSELISCLKVKNIKPIIKTLLEFEEDLFTEEIHNLLFKHHKIKIKDMYD